MGIWQTHRLQSQSCGRTNSVAASAALLFKHAFFFGDYDGLRIIQGQPTTSTVPTLFEEQNPGDFSDIGGPVVPGHLVQSDSITSSYFRLRPFLLQQPRTTLSIARTKPSTATHLMFAGIMSLPRETVSSPVKPTIMCRRLRRALCRTSRWPA